MPLHSTLMRLCVDTYFIFALTYLQITEILTLKCYYRMGLPNLTLVYQTFKIFFSSNVSSQGEFWGRSRQHEYEVIATSLLLHFPTQVPGTAQSLGICSKQV